MAKDSDYILELLQEYGMVSDEQVEEAWEEVGSSDGNLDVVDALKVLGHVEEEQLLAMLANQYGMEVVDLSSYVFQDEVIEALSPDVVMQYQVVPVMKHDNIITVAISDPSDVETIDSLRYLLGCDVDAVAASAEQIHSVIQEKYAHSKETVEHYIDELADEEEASAKMLMGALGGDEDTYTEDDTPIVKLVSLLIVDAHKLRASDIHLEPLEKRYRVRYRVDGRLIEQEAPPKYLQANLTSRLKIMSKLDITEKRIPQDGRIRLKMGDVDIDLRVSTIPTTHGESIVMRILDKSSIQLDIPKLGFLADDFKMINEIISLPDGIFLVTGPTGSGKTTSLYAFLNTINLPTRKLITVEDPVEYQLDGINQVQVAREINMTFSTALRAMLRQSPDIIMVGEIRDLETAEIAINAALTGHLVFSTLHTNDAPGAITRLIDMGVKNFLVASGVRAIMAQRLLRRNCSECVEEAIPTPAECRLLGIDADYLENHKFYKGAGCSNCDGTGYRGRIGIYEIFILTPDIGELIFANEPSSVIRDQARKNGMRSLRDDGLHKAESGISSIEEVIRLTLQDSE
ncbi:MAG: Flp pilus assembly complex ATPase component TadA [Victivallales bacterium]|nr:Flp pilus assembly complex ATPase component TadA [Victivallales bacterium]